MSNFRLMVAQGNGQSLGDLLDRISRQPIGTMGGMISHPLIVASKVAEEEEALLLTLVDTMKVNQIDRESGDIYASLVTKSFRIVPGGAVVVIYLGEIYYFTLDEIK